MAFRISPQARLEKALARAGRGHQLRLDGVRGVVLVDIVDASEGVIMNPGEAIARVWTDGDPADVLRTIEANRIAGTLIVAEIRPPTAWIHLRAWWRWRAFRWRTWKIKRSIKRLQKRMIEAEPQSEE